MTIILHSPELAPPRPVHGLATDDQRALLAWADAHPIDRPGQPDAGDGDHYPLPDPDTGEARKWTRVTTFCEAIDSAEGLTKWKLGLTVRGLVHRDDLLTQARHEHDNDTAVRNIAEQAHLWAGSKLSAAVGTALHTATEHHDHGTGHRPPAPWDRHVDAWGAALAAHGIEILPDWIERIVIHPELGLAGKLDRIARLPDGRLVVVDIKTGADKYDTNGRVKTYAVKKVAYAVQAAVYAHATHAWSADGYEPMPAIDQEMALIAHLSADKGTCDLWAIDIAKGWDKAQACHAIRQARSVAQVFTRWEPPATEPQRHTPADEPAKLADLLPDLENSIRARGIEPGDNDAAERLAERTKAARTRLKDLDASDRARVVAMWPTELPTKPPWTVANVTDVEIILHAITGQDTDTFGEADPGLVAATAAKLDAFVADITATAPVTVLSRDLDDGPHMDTDDGAALRSAAAALPDHQRDHLAAWQAEAKLSGRGWGAVKPAPTQRTHAVVLAALRCVTELWDDDDPDALTRAALSLVIGEDIQPAWRTGAVLGSLTIDEALDLEELAACFASNPATIGQVVAPYTKEQ